MGIDNDNRGSLHVAKETCNEAPTTIPMGLDRQSEVVLEKIQMRLVHSHSRPSSFM